jgi:hypothetical protein
MKYCLVGYFAQAQHPACQVPPLLISTCLHERLNPAGQHFDQHDQQDLTHEAFKGCGTSSSYRVFLRTNEEMDRVIKRGTKLTASGDVYNTSLKRKCRSALTERHYSWWRFFCQLQAWSLDCLTIVGLLGCVLGGRRCRRSFLGCFFGCLGRLRCFIGGRGRC